jgi:hypothetical protein
VLVVVLGNEGNLKDNGLRTGTMHAIFNSYLDATSQTTLNVFCRNQLSSSTNLASMPQGLPAMKLNPLHLVRELGNPRQHLQFLKLNPTYACTVFLRLIHNDLSSLLFPNIQHFPSTPLLIALFMHPSIPLPRQLPMPHSPSTLLPFPFPSPIPLPPPPLQNFVIDKHRRLRAKNDAGHSPGSAEALSHS